MNTHRPPFGARLVQRLLPFQDTDALLGDITEEAQHRSRLWYWTQIVSIVLVGSWRDVRRHPLMAIRAVAGGIVVFVVLFPLTAGLVNDVIVTPLMLAVINAWFRSTSLARVSDVSFHINSASTLVVFYAVLAASGWLVGRMHRRHGITLVLVLAIFIAVLLFVLDPQSVHVSGSDYRVISRVHYARFPAVLASVLVGGYWSTRARTAMTATRLLRRLLPSAEAEAVFSHITEEARHRSRLGYWAQVWTPLVVGSWLDVRRHPVLALRAAGIGLLTLFVVFLPVPALLRVGRTVSDWAYSVGPYWLALRPNALTWLPSIVNPIAFAASGWAIARTNRSHGIAMLLPWTLLVCVLPLITINAVVTAPGPTSRLFAPAIGGIISTISLPAWVLVGGVLGIRRAPTESENVPSHGFTEGP